MKDLIIDALSALGVAVLGYLDATHRREDPEAELRRWPMRRRK